MKVWKSTEVLQYKNKETWRRFLQAHPSTRNARYLLLIRLFQQATSCSGHRAMREYVTRRGWTIALRVREVGSGAVKRDAREKLLEAARRREIDVVLVWLMLGGTASD